MVSATLFSIALVQLIPIARAGEGLAVLRLAGVLGRMEAKLFCGFIVVAGGRRFNH